MSHTPGPWQYDEMCEAVETKDETRILCDIFGDADEQIANGHLIAAAPELLEMLKQARCYVASFASNRDDVRAEAVRDDIDAIIAKATGAK